MASSKVNRGTNSVIRGRLQDVPGLLANVLPTGLKRIKPLSIAIVVSSVSDSLGDNKWAHPAALKLAGKKAAFCGDSSPVGLLSEIAILSGKIENRI